MLVYEHLATVLLESKSHVVPNPLINSWPCANGIEAENRGPRCREPSEMSVCVCLLRLQTFLQSGILLQSTRRESRELHSEGMITISIRADYEYQLIVGPGWIKFIFVEIHCTQVNILEIPKELIMTRARKKVFLLNYCLESSKF